MNSLKSCGSQARSIQTRLLKTIYLLLRREREEIRCEAEAAARRDGFEIGTPELELTPEDEAILDRAWAAVAANKMVGEQEPAPSARAA